MDMSIYTRQQAQQMLGFYIEAEQRVLAGKTITKDGRTWSRENLADIRKGRQEWEQIVRNLSSPRRGPALAEFE
jgi:hypothetical protein